MTGPRRDGSGDWLGALYERFAASLFRYASMILADRAAAADAVQQVFLKLAKSGSGSEDGSTPGAGICGELCGTSATARCARAGARSW
jgi:hypothetical protein